MDQTQYNSFSSDSKKNDFKNQDEVQLNLLESPISHYLDLQHESPNFLENSLQYNDRDKLNNFQLEEDSQKEDDFSQSEEENSGQKIDQFQNTSEQDFNNNTNIKQNFNKQFDVDFEQTNTQNSEINLQKTDVNFNTQSQYQIVQEKDQICLKHLRVEKNIKITHYFLMKGCLLIDDEMRSFETEKRFSEFIFLDKILQNKYYYIVLPQLPQKNLSMLVSSNNKQLDQRVKDLDYYLKQLIQIQCIRKDDIFQTFVLQKGNFKEQQTARTEFEIYNKNDQIFNQIFQQAQLWKRAESDRHQYIMKEPYRFLAKQIGSQILYVESVIQNFSLVQKNFDQMINRFLKIYSDCKDSQQIKNLESNVKIRKKLQNLKLTIDEYQDLLKILNSCKIAMQKKQDIYAKAQQIKQDLQNETKNVQRVIKLQIEDEKYDQMIQKIETYLPQDLTLKQTYIQDQLKKLSQSNLKQSFQSTFSFNQYYQQIN